MALYLDKGVLALVQRPEHRQKFETPVQSTLTRRRFFRLILALPAPVVLAACTERADPVVRPVPTVGAVPHSSPTAPSPQVTPTPVSPPVSPPVPGATADVPEQPGWAAPNFYTEVIRQDPRFTSTEIVNDLDLLEPVTRHKVLAIVAAAREQGLELMGFETYRSKQRQEQLFEQGVTKLKAVGVHHFGLACDLVRSVNGRPSWAGDFSLLGRLAHEQGLIWGGDWGRPDQPNDFLDVVHVQRCSVERQPELFAGTWYPDADYNPYDDIAAG